MAYWLIPHLWHLELLALLAQARADGALPDWVLVLLYAAFSEEYYSAGFMHVCPETLAEFHEWLASRRVRQHEPYERDMLAAWQAAQQAT